MKKSGMKRVGICLAVVGAAAVGLTTGCGKKGDDAVKEIQNRGAFRVAICENSGLVKESNGVYSGQEPELVDQISNALNVETEYLPVVNQQAAVDMVKEGTADAAIGMIGKRMGMEETACTVSYASDYYYVITRRGDYSNSPAAFEGRGLSAGADNQDYLRSLDVGKTQPVLSSYSSGEAAIKAIKNKETDGYICHLEEAMRLAGSDDALQFQNLLASEAEEYVMVVRKDAQQLLSGIDIIIDDMTVGVQTEEN